LPSYPKEKKVSPHTTAFWLLRSNIITDASERVDSEEMLSTLTSVISSYKKKKREEKKAYYQRENEH
jgi:hypothetical protein